MSKSDQSPEQYAEHRANRDFNSTARALLLNLGDRNIAKWRLDEQVKHLEALLPLCGSSWETDIKRKRVEALKASVEVRGQNVRHLRIVRSA